MARIFNKRDEDRERMFETRSHEWAAVGLEVKVNRHDARKASQRLALTLPLLVAAVIGEIAANRHIDHLKALTDRRGHHLHHWVVGKTPVTIAAVLVVLALGWLISRDIARLAPVLFRRLDPATAGTVEFLVRLSFMAVTIVGGLAVAGISPGTLALGGAFTAVVLGLAAQQTLGNLFAGIVLLTARPFRVGERVRLQAGAVGGTIEGIVSSLGLLYTTFARGQDRIQVPNNVVLSAVVVPLREPAAINVRVHLGTGVHLAQAEDVLAANVTTPTSRPPTLLLEEVDGDSVIVRVQATPEHHADGARLADEIIAALTTVTGQHASPQHDGRGEVVR
jgi:small conductance mechanosensitive channel